MEAKKAKADAKAAEEAKKAEAESVLKKRNRSIIPRLPKDGRM